jgi:hypothetical protein
MRKEGRKEGGRKKERKKERKKVVTSVGRFSNHCSCLHFQRKVASLGCRTAKSASMNSSEHLPTEVAKIDNFLKFKLI